MPSDSNKEAGVAAAEVPETKPTVADPGLVGRPEDEVVAEHTTVYTNATPDVLESSNHHVLTEAVPITHTPVPDYYESPRAAPPIMGGDLYSILAQKQPVSGTEMQPVAEKPKEVSHFSASNAYAGEVPSSDRAWAVQNTNAYADEVPSSDRAWAPQTTNAYAGEVPSSDRAWAPQNTDPYTSVGTGNVPSTAVSSAEAPAVPAATTAASSAEVPSAPAGLRSVEDQFEPTTEQAWSVRGPASNLLSKGPHEHAEHLNADAAGNVPVTNGDKAATDKVAEAPGAAAGDVKDKATAAPGAAAGDVKDKATAAPGQSEDVATGAASQTKDTATGATSQAKDTATGAVSQAKDKGTGAASQAKDAAKDTTEKPKKLGLVQKMKKALKIGQQNK